MTRRELGQDGDVVPIQTLNAGFEILDRRRGQKFDLVNKAQPLIGKTFLWQVFQSNNLAKATGVKPELE